MVFFLICCRFSRFIIKYARLSLPLPPSRSFSLCAFYLCALQSLGWKRNHFDSFTEQTLGNISHFRKCDRCKNTRATERSAQLIKCLFEINRDKICIGIAMRCGDYAHIRNMYAVGTFQIHTHIHNYIDMMNSEWQCTGCRHPKPTTISVVVCVDRICALCPSARCSGVKETHNVCINCNGCNARREKQEPAKYSRDKK